jgi:hypothetical protein
MNDIIQKYEGTLANITGDALFVNLGLVYPAYL